MDIQNKTIWITGASSGIGEALAINLANDGASLILSARSEDKLRELVKHLPNSNKHSVVPLDLANANDLENAIAKKTAQLPSVDALINNGGISIRGEARDIALHVQREVMEVNYFGTIALTQLLLPLLEKAGGKVVNIASVAGKVGGQSMSGYAASKHALIGYMDCLRAEEARNGISVLNVCPGFVQTQISVHARTANGEEFGEVADSIATGITAAECAQKINKAMRADKNEVVIGKGISGWAPTLKRLFPGLVMKIAASKNVR